MAKEPSAGCPGAGLTVLAVGFEALSWPRAASARSRRGSRQQTLSNVTRRRCRRSERPHAHLKGVEVVVAKAGRRRPVNPMPILAME